MAAPDERKCLYNNEPVCPYCGHEQSDFWEMQGEDGNCECGNCSRLFRWSRYVEVSYSTAPIIGPHKLSDYAIDDDAHENPIPKEQR